MKIKILDSIECEISKGDAAVIVPCLSFESSYWVQGPLKKSRKVYKKNVFSFKGKQVWRFYTGLLPRVLEYCKKNSILVELVGEELKIKPQKKPHLDGITFRDDQLKLIDAACGAGRGVVVSPTQSGKTLVFLGIMSCYQDLNILVLSHTTAITKQTFDRLKKYNFTNIESFGGGKKIQPPSKRIVVSTIQSFSRLDPRTYSDYFDCIIVDEFHLVSKHESQYEKVLSKLLAPIRLGFSATPLTNKEAVLTYEGLLGSIIGELKIEEAAKLEIINPPILKLVKAKHPQELSTIWNYQDSYEKVRENGKLVNGERIKVGAYSAGVVENQFRNSQIAEIVKKDTSEGKVVFIFVTYTYHGELLQAEIEKLTHRKVPFVQGNTSEKERDIIKKNLENKEELVCIATVAWAMGITIKTINSLILAGAGKSPVKLIQQMGRTFGKYKGKDRVTVYYMLDLCNRHLISHTGENLSTFSDQGWL